MNYLGFMLIAFKFTKIEDVLDNKRSSDPFSYDITVFIDYFNYTASYRSVSEYGDLCGIIILCYF